MTIFKSRSHLNNPRLPTPHSPYKYQPLPSTHGAEHIRILELLPGQGTVHINLRPACLSDTPAYEPLSYCWGPSEHVDTVLVDGHPFSVTKNLHAALVRLRDPNVSRTLWIDAICVNQGDNHERSQQVGVMADIYRRGVRTVVWLGEEDGNTRRVLDLLRFIAGHSNGLENAWGYYELRNVLDKKEPSLSQTSPQFPALITHLGRLPWFSRVWIVQEVALSRHVTVNWGAHEFAWDLLEKAQEVMRSNLAPNLTELIELRKLSLRGEYDFSLQATVVANITREATDTRDKIHALLGLVPHDTRHGLRADYSKTTLQVLRDFTVSCLKSSDRLTILSFAQGCKPTSPYRDGPSWLIQPERQKSADVAELDIFGYRDYMRGKLFRATMDTDTSRLEIDLQHNALLVPGIQLDSVIQVCDTYFNPYIAGDDSGSFSNLKITSQFTVLLLTWCDEFDIPRTRSSRRMNATSSATMRETLTPLHQLTTSMSKRLSTHSDELRSAFDAYINLHTYFRHVPRFLGRDSYTLHSLTWLILLLYCRVSDTLSDNLDLGGVLDWSHEAGACQNRRLFRTKSGCWGLGPLWMDVGDCVTLFEGARVPFLTRETKGREGGGEGWMIVGEACVDGIMEGQAWKETKCKIIRVV